jgi:hypothetical protein
MSPYKHRPTLRKGMATTMWKRSVVVTSILVVIAVVMAISPTWTLRSNQSGSPRTENNKLVEDSIVGIPFYSCSTPSPSSTPTTTTATSTPTTTLVLLHGAAFTKEDWKTSGIFDRFCHSMPGRSVVVALDLPVSAGQDELQNILTALATMPDSSSNNKVAATISLPVTLVTPSASGYSMVDWVKTDTSLEIIPRFVNHWIPVASKSVTSLSDDELERLQTISILAIYGDQDSSGKQTSELLGAKANARVLELMGRHPVYLDSPGAFVTQVVNFISTPTKTTNL